MANPFDDAEQRTFETIMQKLDGHGVHVYADRPILTKVARFIIDSGANIEAAYPATGSLETATALFVVLERDELGTATLGELALRASNAFSKRKNLFIFAPRLPEQAVVQITALRFDAYFSHAGLTARVLVADTEFDAVSRAATTHSKSQRAPMSERSTWSAISKCVFWLVTGTTAYLYLRHAFARDYADLLVTIPFWLKAFYGCLPEHAAQLHRSPKQRLISANSAVVPFLLVALLVAVVIAPSYMPVLALGAFVVEGVAFVSADATAVLLRSTKLVPNFFR